MPAPPPPYPAPPEDPLPRRPSGGIPPDPPETPPTGQPPPYPAAPPVYGPPGVYPQAPPTSGLAIASLVCGILTVFCSVLCGCLAMPLGIAALITGFIGRNEIRASSGQLQGNGLAMAGIITGGIGLLLAVIVLAFALIFGAIAAASNPAR